MFRGGKRASGDGAPARRKNQNDSSRSAPADIADRYAFRRNRTLTGSSSAQVASSNEMNAELKSPRAHVHHLTSLRRKLLLYFSCVALASFALYLLVSQLVAAQTVQVAGVGTVPSSDEAAYQKAIDTYYGARPTERLRFLLNMEEFLAHLQAARPEVRQVYVEPGGRLGQATIRIVSRVPIAHWSISGDDQFVDDEGIVFSKNYHANPKLQIVDNSGIQATNNKLVASDRFLGFVGRVIARANASGLKVDKVTIPELTTRQVAINLVGKRTYYKLSIDRSAGQQVEDIARIDKYFAAKGLSPEYADVRLSGKAYYK